MVSKLKRKPLRAQGKSGHHNVPGRNQEVAWVVHGARLCVASLQKRRKKRETEMKRDKNEERCKRYK